jgi:hypothetical protein
VVEVGANRASVIVEGLCQSYQALGQPHEAAELAMTMLTSAKGADDLEKVSRWASIGCELNIALGNIWEAINAGTAGLDAQKKRGSTSQFSALEFALAHAEHLAGFVTKAESRFGVALRVDFHQDDKSDAIHKWLHGYRACDLLLTLGGRENLDAARGLAASGMRREEVSVRVPIVTKTLNQLMFGWVMTRLANIDGQAVSDSGGFKDESQTQSIMSSLRIGWKHINLAIDGLRNQDANQYLPKGLVLRAAFQREWDNMEEAEKDLAEALDIAEAGGMKLELVDVYLEQARWHLARQARDEDDDEPAWGDPTAEALWDRANKLIKGSGYLRRMPELIAIRSCLDGRIPYSHQLVAPDVDETGAPSAVVLTQRISS